MAILTWQNVPIPDIGSSLQQGVRTASDLLSKAASHGSTAVTQLQVMEDAKKAAQTQAADRFVLENMLRAETPEQLAQMKANGSLTGPAQNHMSTDMLGKIDSRQDTLNIRADQSYARDRGKVLDGRADEKYTTDQALAARRKQQEAGLTEAYGKAMRGDWSAVNKWLQSNPDFEATTPQAAALFNMLNQREELSLRWAAKKAAKAGSEEDARIRGLAGQALKLVGYDRANYDAFMGKLSDPDFLAVSEVVQKNTPPELKSWSHTPNPEVPGRDDGSQPGSGGGGGGGKSSPGAPAPQDIVTRSIQAEIEKGRKDNPGVLLMEEAQKFEGKSDADIAQSVAKLHDMDPSQAMEFIVRVRETYPTASTGKIGAALHHPDAFDRENPFEWVANMIAAPFGASDSVDRGGGKGNLDFSPSRVEGLIDSTESGKAGFTANKTLQEKAAKYQKDLSESSRLVEQLKRGRARGLDTSDIESKLRTVAERIFATQRDYPTATGSAPGTPEEELLQTVPPPSPADPEPVSRVNEILSSSWKTHLNRDL